VLHYSTHQLLSHQNDITCKKKKKVNPYFNVQPKLVVTNSPLLWGFSVSFCNIQAAEKCLRGDKRFLELKRKKKKDLIA